MSSPSLSEETPPVLPGEVLAEKYRVERVLGRGGMGFVVAARNMALGKRVAIKMMLPAAMNVPLALERFEREARAAVQLKSEHVAEVLDIGRLPTGEPYIVMELLDGSDFEAVLEKQHTLPVEEAVDYLLQVCEAVAEAHALGIVHRDLKPKNLFLSHRLDGSPVVKVLDFGISKWTLPDGDSHSLTRTSDVFGSPNYMSPEQIRSARDVDGRTDVWSIGVILFELLTGRVPFVAESLPQLCSMVLEHDAPLVSTLRPDVPPGVDAIVERCLERAREQRFQGIGELVRALAPFGSPRHVRTGSGRISSPAESASTIAVPLVGSGTGGSWEQDTAPGRRSVPWLAGLTAVPLLVMVGIGALVLGGRRGGTGADQDAASSAA
ncbi:MAG: Serine/threonine protein kinase PrkC, regulator of stationary phase, partial [Labilithrix sp.]|nr:Serine/threonine protein kinase PrkC, regulator of stationary phase [Labilithrix sp.]